MGNFRLSTVALTVILVMTTGCNGIAGSSVAGDVDKGMAAYKAGNYENATASWERAAKNGNSDAAYYLGVMANEGKSGDASAAAKWFRQAAEKGHVKAQYNLALAYERGLGVTRDRTQSLSWLEKASKQGDAEAQYMYGLLLLDQAGTPPDPTQLVAALDWIKKAANAGNPRAQMQLGAVYLDGILVDPSPREAVIWLGKALEGGTIEALRPMVQARNAADASTKSEDELKRLASQGDAEAQHELAGKLLRKAKDKDDISNGMEWLNKSAHGGNVKGQYDLALQLLNSDTPNVPAGVEWLRKSAAKGYPQAEYALGKVHAEGVGMEKDEVGALKWYRKAADRGFPLAEYAVGYMYSEGSGVQRDDAQAISWFKRAAEHGHGEAAFRIGTMYANGEGVSKDPSEVRRWECRAMVLGSERAAGNIGRKGGFDSACEPYRDDLAKFAVRVLGSDGSKPAGS